MQASMVEGKNIELSPAQIKFNKDNFSKEKIKMPWFLKKKIYARPDGALIDEPLTETGLSTQGLDIMEETTYKDLYVAQYGRYDFPV